MNDDFLDVLAADFDLDVLTELFSVQREADATDHIARSAYSRGSLSFQQHRMWLHQYINPTSNAYNIPRAYFLNSDIDIARLNTALQHVLEKHAILRTRYQGDSEPEQYIDENAQVNIELLTHPLLQSGQLSPQALLAEPEIKAWLNQPFDLATSLPIRAAWIPAQTGGVLLLCNHHIASDAWSKPIMLTDLVKSYLGQPIGENTIRYLDYAQWQQAYLSGKMKDKVLDYWCNYCPEAPESLCFSGHLQYRESLLGHVVQSKLNYSTAQLQKLNAYCQQHGITLSSLLMTAYQAVLATFSDNKNFLIGIPTAGRNHPQVSDLVGCFINTQVYKNVIDIELPLLTSAKINQQHTLSILDLDLIPYEWLAEQLAWPKEEIRHNYYQALFNYVEEDKAKPLALPLNITSLNLSGQGAQFELGVDIRVTEHGLNCIFEADAGYYGQAFLDKLVLLFDYFTSQLVESEVNTPFADMVLPPSVYDSVRLDNALNLNEQLAPDTAIRILGGSIAQNQHRHALVSEGLVLTYAQLWRKVQQQAQQLRLQGIAPEDRVAIHLENKVQQVISLLAVMLAGGTVVIVPDPLPKTRIRQICQQAQVKRVITQEITLFTELLGDAVTCINPLEHAEQPFASVSDLNMTPPYIYPEQLAYIIFTSGSTGVPKGVAVSHGELYSHLQAVKQRYQYTQDDIGLVFASLAFDAGLEQLLVPLLSGACSYVVDGQDTTPEQLANVIKTAGITVVDLPPSYLNQCYELGAVRACIVGGEGWHRAHLETVLSRFPSVRFYNAYGPTEAVISATVWCASEISEPVTTIYAPIGGAVGKRELYVLDKALRQVPQGVQGELYIYGYLARGYIGRPDLTAERFIANPFATDGSRLYRTGDLVRWDESQQLIYISRTDQQVKVRGFRIELAEIEAQLQTLAEVQEAVVLLDDKVQPVRLVGYVISALAGEEIKRLLSAQVASYMVPSIIMNLEIIPLNHNGKVDRRALPQVEITQENYVAPVGAIETLLAEAWLRVLGVKQVGREDNFFALGGDSILCLQVISHMRQYGWILTPKQLFEYPTVAQLATVVTAADHRHVIAQQVSGDVDLLPIQAVFFQQPLANPQHWNQAVMLHAEHPLDKTALATACAALLAHHDSLRLRYRNEGDGAILQYYADYAEDMVAASLWQRVVATDEITNVAESAQRSLHLFDGPLLRIVNMDVEDGSARLLLVVHHLVIDGVSWRVLLEDLQNAYESAVQQQKVTLADKSHSFQYWAAFIRAYPEQFHDEIHYWQTQTAAKIPWPYLDITGSQLVKDTSKQSISLSKQVTEALLQDATRPYKTQINDLLLSALSEALYQWLGVSDCVVNLEGHGREAWDDTTDLSRTLGWFTAIYPVKLQHQSGLRETICQVKEAIRAIPNKGIGYGAFKYGGDVATQQLLTDHASHDIEFNYLGQFDNTFKVGQGSDNPWQPALESTGSAKGEDAIQESELSIIGQVYDEQLTLTISYCHARLASSSIATFAHCLQQSLEGIVAHCLAADVVLTPSDVPLSRLDQAALHQLAIPHQHISTIYPLSPMQQALLFFTLNGGQTHYVCQMRFDVFNLQEEKFKAAWQQVVNRHDVLRTAFILNQDIPLQVVAKRAQLDWQVIDIDESPDVSILQRVDAIATEEAERGFDLEKDFGLTRIKLLRAKNGLTHLIWTCHHILTDGWSTSQMMGELLSLYTEKSLPPVSAQYVSYIEYLQGQDKTQSDPYWLNKVRQLNAPSLLTAQLQGSAVSAHHSNELLLSTALTDQLMQFSKQHGVTLNTILQGALAILLSRYLDQTNVCFGMLTSGRPTDLVGVATMQGLLINTLAVITQVRLDEQPVPWLQALQQEVIALREHEHTPLVEVNRRAAKYFEIGQDGLFDTLLVVENYPISEGLKESKTTTRFAAKKSLDETNYPLTISATLGSRIHFSFGYRNERISAEWIEVLQTQFISLLTQMTAVHSQKLAELDWFNSANCPTLLPSHESFIVETDGNLKSKALSKPQVSQLSRDFVAPETALEQQLALIWQRILQVEQVSRTDNFFALGGDSINCLHVVTSAKKVGIEMSITNVFTSHDLAELASKVIFN